MNNTSKKSFVKNVATLITGSVIAQVISLAGLILLQRYFYGPEDFAPFRLFFEYIAIFVGISSLRLDSAIILEKDPNNAKSLSIICFKLIALTAIVSLVSFLIYTQFSTNFNALSNQSGILILIPFTVIVLGSLQVFNSWFTRLEKFKLMSKNKVFQSTLTIVSQLSFGLLKFNFFGLIIGKFIGVLGANFIFLKNYFNAKKSVKSNFNQQKQLVKKHKKFILFTSPAFFAGTIINFIFLALFIELYGNQIGGQIAASVQYLGISIAIIASSFSQVYFSEISKLTTKSELRSTYSYWSKRLGCISICGVILIHFIPDSMVSFLLSDKWSGLIDVMKIMSIWMAIMFISTSLSYIYIKLGRQKETLIFDIVHLFLVVGSIYFAHNQYNSPTISLWSFTLTQCVFYAFAIFAAYYFISKFKEEASE